MEFHRASIFHIRFGISTMPGEFHYNFTSLSVCSCSPSFLLLLSLCHPWFWSETHKERTPAVLIFLVHNLVSFHIFSYTKSMQISSRSGLSLSMTISLWCENVAGFEDARNACCGLGKYGGMKGCLSPDMACQRASNHVWWDLYNPTEAVNILLANSAWSGDPLSSICRPFTLKALGSSSY